jgi:KaiC/GvpD/RAD55 family RecA-like ATPase
METRERIETSIEGFDVWLGGGIAHRQAIVIARSPRSGETVPSAQMKWARERTQR